ncbi:SAG family member [Eimeria maxima]|uniref:SAG family member n=1 Tax=Eimeria maxima TaxID=5804 RepID=U6MGF9_EIMMA|nr:SAG family member [Eimeria maxima]CDJ61529.1 SAG family member [Eimeria maxima]
MKTFSSVLLAAAVLGAGLGVNGLTSGDPKGSSSPAECLEDFNAARKRAGLKPFTAEQSLDKKMPTSDDGYINSMCQKITGEETRVVVKSTERTGTYAFAPATDSEDGCSAAVSFWKEVHTNFQEPPPVYNQSEEGVYGDSRVRSFVALYSTAENATIDCAYITCPVVTKTTTPIPSSTATTTTSTTVSAAPTTPQSPQTYNWNFDDEELAKQRENGSGASVRRLSDAVETVTSLVCLTNPAALVDQKMPFS